MPARAALVRFDTPSYDVTTLRLWLANDSSPWLTPEEGAEIIVPFNLRVLPEANDTLVTIAYRFYGDMNRAWVLDRYNLLNGRKLQPGDVVLVPLTELPLTEAGRQLARQSLESWGELGGEHRSQQRTAGEELPELLADMRAGRYSEAVARGVTLLAGLALLNDEAPRIGRVPERFGFRRLGR